MAHNHLHLKDDICSECTHSKQTRIGIALLGTLAGGVLLISSGLSKIFYRQDVFTSEILAMLGAVLLGAPVVWHALKSLIQKHAHMD